MSSTKSKIEPAELPTIEEREAIQRPTFSTTELPKPNSNIKQRGPNVTPKQLFRVGRDWDNHTWMRALDAHIKREQRAAYSKRNELK